MLSVFFAFVSFVGWGLGDILGAVATRKLGTFSVTFWASLATVFFSSLYLPFVLDNFSLFTPTLFIFNVFLGILLLFGFVSFNEGMRIGNVSVVGTIASAFPALTVILSLVFLKEKITVLQCLAIGVIFMGILCSAIDIKQLKKAQKNYDRGVLLAIVTFLIWGFYFTFIKLLVQKVGWFLPNYISFLLFPILLSCFAVFRKVRLVKPTKDSLLPLIFCVLLLRSADFSFNIAVSIGLTAVVAPIAGSSSTLFAPVAYFVFKDPIRKHQIIGLLLTIIGIVLLAIFSS